MLKLINLADNSEKEISTSDLQNLNLANMWIDATSPTEEEIKTRSEALELAQYVHDKLDIRPLTTTTIVRQLREEKEGRG